MDFRKIMLDADLYMDGLSGRDRNLNRAATDGVAAERRESADGASGIGSNDGIVVVARARCCGDDGISRRTEVEPRGARDGEAGLRFKRLRGRSCEVDVRCVGKAGDR